MLLARASAFSNSTAQKTWRVQVEIEQVVLGFAIVRVQGHCLFKILAGFGCMHAGHQPAAGFRAPSPSAAEPKFVLGIGGRNCESLLKEFDGFLIVAQHEVVLAAQKVAGRIGRRIFRQDTQRILVLGALVERAGPAHYIGRSPSGENQKQESTQYAHRQHDPSGQFQCIAPTSSSALPSIYAFVGRESCIRDRVSRDCLWPIGRRRRRHSCHRSAGDREMRNLPHARRAGKHAAHFLGANHARRLAGRAETNDPGERRHRSLRTRPGPSSDISAPPTGWRQRKPSLSCTTPSAGFTRNQYPERPCATACAKCHSFARALSWRRSPDDWKQFADLHAIALKLPPNEEAVAFLSKAAPLHTPEWDAWSAHERTPNLAGRWLVTASIPGRGKYYGEMQVDRDPATANSLPATSDVGQRWLDFVRSGRIAVYGGYAWRGRSKGLPDLPRSAPDDLCSEAREVLWIAPGSVHCRGPLVLGTVSGIRLRCEAAPRILCRSNAAGGRSDRRSSRVRKPTAFA